MIARLILTCALVWGLALGAAAQGAPDALWDSVASRAEGAVDQGVENDAVYEALRDRIAKFRAGFDDLRKQNAERIATLRKQIAALGEVPTDAAAEPETAEIAAQRAKLEQQLAALLAPVQVADAAYRRADGLVGEIDKILRERQKQKLLSLGPTPLNPAHWPVAVGELSKAWGHVFAPGATLGQEGKLEILKDSLPAVVLAALAGFVLILRGRRWSVRIVSSISKIGGRGSGVWRFVASLLRIILPFAGLSLLCYAAIRSGFFGPLGTEILTLLPVLGGIALGIRWVADRIFSRDDEEALILLSPERRAEVRFYIGVVGILIVLGGVAELLLDQRGISVETRAVSLFPFSVLMGLFLFRIGQVLRSFADAPPPEEEEQETVRASGLRRMVRVSGLGAMGVAVAGIAMAAVGYGNAAAALLNPYLLSLVLLGLVMVLQRFAADLYGTLTRQGDAARDALVPVLVGLTLLIMVLPLLALAWGARAADLWEIWAAFSRGFSIGGSRISPVDFLTFAVIFAIGYMATRLTQGALRNNVLPKTKLDLGGQNAIVSGLGYVGIFVAALVAITAAGIDLSSLAIVAGALSVGIGFGLQNIVSNFVSGVILLIERPISEGDWIEVGGQMGYVRAISVRSTRIETFDRTDVIVPNADLVSGTVTNYTRGNSIGRLIVHIGVGYSSDTRLVDTLLREIAEAHPMVLLNPPPTIVFDAIGASSFDFQIRMILRDVNYMMSVKNDINHAIVERLTAEGIEMPYPQQDIWLRNPETLRPQEPK